ncbi:hypothetical protein [Thiomicrospira sp.]|uniref:hypothetical protein n=1 Tax=Thiomicrospira sp. TaxID=935 RepID=UPI002F9355EC
MEFKESKCIGCGCTDSRACIEPGSGHPCSWLRVDRQSGSGVYSCCKKHVERWDEGKRTSGKPKAGILIPQDNRRGVFDPKGDLELSQSIADIVSSLRSDQVKQNCATRKVNKLDID